ncbi:MAG: hypothetical protein Q9227_003224 [Pyrenula ochraceoflavens]
MLSHFSLFALVTITTAQSIIQSSPQSSPSTYAYSLAGPLEGSLKSLLGSILKGAPVTSQVLNTFLEPLEVNIARNSYVTRDGSALKLNGQKWEGSGANVYWLGLDENVVDVPPGTPFYAPLNASYPTFGRITEVMNTLQTMGARTIRSQTLGVSVGNPLSLEPDLNVFNDDAFATIDWSVYQARQHGLRIVAPLIDNYDYYHGGKFTFLRWRGVNISSSDNSHVDPAVLQFYTNPTIVSDFKNYIKHLITHVNPYTGLTYAEDPTIFAYETGNELGGPTFGDMYVPNNWTQDIARFIKTLAPKKLIMDGTYGVNRSHFSVPEIDIFSDHYYPPNNTKLNADIAAVASTNRVYSAGEFDWTGNNPSASSLDSFFNIIESAQNKTEPVVVMDQFWSLFMHDVPDCTRYVNHSDGFALQYGNPANSAMNNSQIAMVRRHLFRMQGVQVGDYLPAVPCPGPTAEYTYL